MELEEPLMQGSLLLPPQGMLGQLKKSWHKKFCQIFKASKYGIQRLEIYENQEEALQQHLQRIITLEACVKIAASSQPNVFTLFTKTGMHHFGCVNESDMSNWISAFQSVAFKDDTPSVIVEEDNDLYCTSGEGVFTVKISETDASRKCGLELGKNYTLVVAATEMKLMDSSSKTLYTWPYQYIRKYGYKEGNFTFEAGRRCGSGEGAFCVEHKNQLEIYRCFVSNKTKMKQMLNGENSPTVENNDIQFHAALSMEAGSRSPLPPSGNSSKNLIDLDIPSFTQNPPPKPLISPISPISPTESDKPPLPAKPKPMKPPRKPVFTTKLDKKPLDFETLDSSASGKYRKLNSPTTPDTPEKNIVVTNDSGNPYDIVEFRKQAWKTHGLDSVPHKERMKTIPKPTKNEKEGLGSPHYETMTFPLSSQNSIKSNSSSIIYNIPSPNDPPDYDRLQHFGSIKSKNKSGYCTPNSTVSQNSQLMSQLSIDSDASYNNYDDVQDISTARLADDSHLGYGMIRKKSNSSISSSNMMEPKHQVVNETEYAIVSKAKRV